MTTRLEGPLKREIDIEGAMYTLTISPDGLRLVPKGKRNGHELAWRSLVNGDAALTQALNASVRGAGHSPHVSRSRKDEPARD